jgi:hypothetical protein
VHSRIVRLTASGIAGLAGITAIAPGVAGAPAAVHRAAKGPCKLVTAKEIEKVTGIPPASPGGVRADRATCAFTLEAADAVVPGSIVIRLVRGAKAKGAYKAGQSPDAKSVKGLGDEAYFDPQGGYAGVLKGKAFLLVGVSRPRVDTSAPDPAEVRKDSLALARLAVRRV